MSAPKRRRPDGASPITLVPKVERIVAAESQPTTDSVPAQPQSEPSPITPAAETPATPLAVRAPERAAVRSARKTVAHMGEQDGSDDTVRPSNVHIPVALLEPLEAKCRVDGLSHGEMIIVAIESTYERLADLVNPAATAGGSLFAPRRSRASRSTDGPLTPLNYRLREADFATLDSLVDQFGASSRGHLITAALKGYFAQS